MGCPNNARPEDVMHDLRRVQLMPCAASSLLARRRVMVCLRRSGMGVRHRRLPALGALSPLARLPRKCRRLSPASWPWGRHRSPALGPRRLLPSRSRSAAIEPLNLGTASVTPDRGTTAAAAIVASGVRRRRALSVNRRCRTRLGGHCCSCIGWSVKN